MLLWIVSSVLKVVVIIVAIIIPGQRSLPSLSPATGPPEQSVTGELWAGGARGRGWGSRQDPGPPCRPQAYEDRQRHWPREREALREDGAAQAQRAQRAQQLLQLQVFQLQQEKRQLQDDFAQLLQEREQLERRCATFEREQRELGPRLEETKWEVGQTRRGRERGLLGTGVQPHPPPLACYS